MFKRRRVCDIRHSSAEEQVQAHTQTLRRDPRSAANDALRLRWWSIVQRTNAGAPNAMRGCDEAPQSVLTHSVRSGTLRGPRSVLFSARTRERTTSYATEVRDTQKGRKVRPGFCGGAAPRAKFPRGSESGRKAERTIFERRSETEICERKSSRRRRCKHPALSVQGAAKFALRLRWWRCGELNPGPYDP